MEKSLIHSNELHFISKKRIHQAVEKMVESLDLAAGSTTGFNIYAVVESYFTDLEKRKEINQLLNLEQDVCEEIEAELSYKYITELPTTIKLRATSVLQYDNAGHW